MPHILRQISLHLQTHAKHRQHVQRSVHADDSIVSVCHVSRYLHDQGVDITIELASYADEV